MATNYYLGSGNWDATTSWSLGSVPVNAEDVLVDRGNYAIPGFDASAVDLTSLRIGAGFTGTLGSAAVPMQINAVTTHITGSQGCYLKGATGKLLQNIIIDKRYAVDTPVQIGGYVTTIDILRGNVTLAGDINTDSTSNVYIMHHGNIMNDVKVVVDAGALITNLHIHGGLTTLNSGVSNVYIYEGEIEHLTGSVGSGVNLYGGLYEWKADETITTLIAIGGKFDATGNIGGTAAPTITTLRQTVNAIVDLRNGLSNIVITNAATLHGTTGPLEDN